MNKVFDSLVEERNNALSMCEKLEKENESLKEQVNIRKCVSITMNWKYFGELHNIQK